MNLIPAVKKNEALLEEVRSLENDPEHFHVWWLGQSGYLLTYKGTRLLIDPYLSDSLTKKYANTNKPHIRMSEQVMAPPLLTNISFVSSSHNHTDHLDGETLIPILKNNPDISFIIPEANRSFVTNRLQCDPAFPVGLNDGKAFNKNGFTYYGIPAAHNTLDRNENGECLYMGYIIKFGSWVVYHSGDTLWFEGMEDILAQHHIHLAFLPINGNDEARGVAGNLNAEEAVALAKKAGIQHVIPCHYDMFTFNTASPEVFAQLAQASQQPYTILPPGGHWSSSLLK